MITIQIQVPSAKFAEVWWRWYLDGEGVDSGFVKYADEDNVDLSGILQKWDKAAWTIKHEE